jgi:hypothetical protein
MGLAAWVFEPVGLGIDFLLLALLSFWRVMNARLRNIEESAEN